MKKGIHPENYRLVAFKDMSNNDVFITKSAVETKDTISVDGAEYPLVKLEISRTSHPYYTGKSKLVDTAGRIDKFKSRYANLSINKHSVEEAPVSKEAPVDETPLVEEAKVVKEKPVDETPLVKEASVEEEAPSSEESSE
jgi:large subunit ribosomal protein L31